MACSNCGFVGDPDTGDIYDVTYPCPNCGSGGARVASFEVKRLAPETVLQVAELSSGKSVGTKSPNSITYAVVDDSGRVVFTKSRLTGKLQPEIWPRRSVAEQSAERLNQGTREYSLGEKVAARTLSPEAIAWLHQWSFSDMTKPPTPEVVAELSKYRPKSSVKLYRFEATPEMAKHKKLRSFTYERGMVEFMAETDEQQGGHGEIVEETVHPSRILVDMTRLPPPFKGGGEMFLNEVIVSSGPLKTATSEFTDQLEASPATLRVAARFLKAAGYFSVGDLVWLGKYKNKLAIITAFGEDAKGNPTITVSPIPKGRKQDKTFGLFKVWKVRPEQIAELKAKGKIASSRVLDPPSPLPDYVPAAKKPTLFTREDGIEIAGGLWQDGAGSLPNPELSFIARLGPETLPKLKKRYKGTDGIATLHLHPDPKEPGTFWTGQVAVSPKFQRMGIATDLYREAVKWLRQHGGKLRQGWITSEAAAKMWEKWNREGLAEGKYLKMDKWSAVEDEDDDDWEWR